MSMAKKDTKIEVFMGSEYTISAETVGELREALRGIIRDLPDDHHKIAELHTMPHNGINSCKLSYMLTEGVH